MGKWVVVDEWEVDWSVVLVFLCVCVCDVGELGGFVRCRVWGGF